MAIFRNKRTAEYNQQRRLLCQLYVDRKHYKVYDDFGKITKDCLLASALAYLYNYAFKMGANNEVTKKGKLKDERDIGWFYCTVSTMKEEAFISEKKQTACLQKLQKMGLIQFRKVGIPPKRHIYINYHEVQKLIDALPMTPKRRQRPRRNGA